jgi:hypothetical protein
MNVSLAQIMIYGQFRVLVIEHSNYKFVPLFVKQKKPSYGIFNVQLLFLL